MSGSESEQLDQHATARHAGFPADDPEFEAIRVERARLVDRFLKIMNDAGNPGPERKLGSTVRNITGQQSDEFWAAILVGDDGTEREVVVFTDGRHGWSDELAYSDRPRSRDDEIRPPELRAALTGILEQNGLSWDERED